MRKKLEKQVLAEGEVTGHAHRVDVDVLEEDDGTKIFQGTTTVIHEEHKPIPITKDMEWASGQVREMDYDTEEAQRVRD